MSGIGLSLAFISSPKVLSSVVTNLKQSTLKNGLQLKAGDIYIAQAGKVVALPTNPVNGDQLHVVVDTSSVLKPCRLEAMGAKVAGDRNGLVLDTLANIRLTYDANTRDWRLS